eukprot:CAMPEP_0118869796 /NCGR_PEP_ID=MMETSP1163-20130328/13006_1 /TAXON_ID=124430 /ORGANISM="Phaeomonas parva, Strain CCMP2877" /LENGTH=704 /DNA_ID=CAMNT_0006804727 /DNA_START=5 /DNA_END=2116 /DNA_ORIENTATION=+
MTSRTDTSDSHDGASTLTGRSGASTLTGRSSASSNASTADVDDSFAIENMQSTVKFIKKYGKIAPGQRAVCPVKCLAGRQTQRLREVVECHLYSDLPFQAPGAELGEQPLPPLPPADDLLSEESGLSSFLRGCVRYPSEYVALRGEVQSPCVYVDTLEHDVGMHFVDVPISRSVKLINLSNLETRFRWERPGIAAAEPGTFTSATNSVHFEPAEGVLRGKEVKTIHITLKALKAGILDDVCACRIFGVKQPLGFSVKGMAKGVVVSYESLLEGQAPPKPLADPFEPQLPDGDLPSPGEAPELNLGESVELFTRSTSRFVVRNFSAIPSKFRFSLRNLHVAPPPENKYGVQLPGAKKESIFWEGSGWKIAQEGPVCTEATERRLAHMHDMLKRRREELQGKHGPAAAEDAAAHDAEAHGGGKSVKTASSPRRTAKAATAAGGGAKGVQRILDNKVEKTEKFASKMGFDYVQAKILKDEDALMLKTYKGAAFALRPAAGVLPPWGIAVVEITSFNDMPGEFVDEINCDVEGCPATRLPIFMQVEGCPLKLRDDTVGLRPPEDPSELKTRWKGMPRLCFGNLTCGSPPSARMLSVLNEGPKPAKLSWAIKEPGDNDEDDRLVEVKLSTVVRGGRVRVRVGIGLKEEQEYEPPFEIIPTSALVPARGRAEFQVLLPEILDEATLKAMLTADAFWDVDAESGSVASSSR